jgi:hypothetical protein
VTTANVESIQSEQLDSIYEVEATQFQFDTGFISRSVSSVADEERHDRERSQESLEMHTPLNIGASGGLIQELRMTLTSMVEVLTK